MVNLIRWWSGGVPSSLFHDSDGACEPGGRAGGGWATRPQPGLDEVVTKSSPGGGHSDLVNRGGHGPARTPAQVEAELIGGALMTLILMLGFETPRMHWTAHFAEALAWNTLMMSIGGMAIYSLMLERYGAGRASSGFFVVPGASAILAMALLSEHLSTMAIAGLAASTVGVVLVWWKPKAI